jgi:hypothetical protein
LTGAVWLSDGQGERARGEQDRHPDDEGEPGDRADRERARLPSRPGDSGEALLVGFRQQRGVVDPSEIEFVNEYVRVSFVPTGFL